jgi:hypothetical protein
MIKVYTSIDFEEDIGEPMPKGQPYPAVRCVSYAEPANQDRKAQFEDQEELQDQRRPLDFNKSRPTCHRDGSGGGEDDYILLILAVRPISNYTCANDSTTSGQPPPSHYFVGLAFSYVGVATSWVALVSFSAYSRTPASITHPQF